MELRVVEVLEREYTIRRVEIALQRIFELLLSELLLALGLALLTLMILPVSLGELVYPSLRHWLHRGLGKAHGVYFVIVKLDSRGLKRGQGGEDQEA